MSFSLRLAVSIAVLVACTAVMGVAALFTMNDLHARLDATDELYAEVRGLYEIGHRAAAARLLLNAQANGATTADQSEVRQQLLAALRETERLAAEHSSDARGEDGVPAALKQIRDNIQTALVTDRNASGSRATPDHIQLLQSSLNQIASLAAAANRDILDSRQQTTQQVASARWTLGLLLGATTLLAIGLGVSQHRSIATPLRALRGGVQRLASRGDGASAVSNASTAIIDASPIPEVGPREFRGLIRQFNGMSEEIHALQDSLSKQVETKSRQLIRSERLAGLGYLAAGLAHEINNPLGVIGGYAETMLRRLETPAALIADSNAHITSGAMLHDLADALRTISEEVFRCQDITQGLLQMTRAGAAEDRMEPIDLGALVERTVHMLQRLPLCHDRRLRMETTCLAPVLARGSRAQLTQVLLNLITNALEATEPRRGEVVVSVGVQAGSVLIRVQDNGCGMSPETLTHVFDPLFSDKPRRGLTGFGLGLSISHAIIERHGGRIDASSEGPGRGSAFVTELPAVSAATAAAGWENA